MSDEETVLHVVCTECSFSKKAPVDEERQPADILVEHGKRTGHTLKLEPIE